MGDGASKIPAGTPVELIQQFDEYVTCRNRYLRTLNLSSSNRDPGYEFAEHFIAAIVGGKLADSRVQSGWDVMRPDRRTIQVRTLWNTHVNTWLNEHTIKFPQSADEYVLVIFLNHKPRWIVAMDRSAMPVLRTLLKKTNKAKSEITLTASNLKAMCDRPQDFEDIGVRVIELPHTGPINIDIKL
jgi:hypothetical protein